MCLELFIQQIIHFKYINIYITFTYSVNLETPINLCLWTERGSGSNWKCSSTAKNLILIMFSFTLDIYCTSVRPGRGIPHMWLSLRFLLSFYLLKGFFSSFSSLLLRVKGRGCHTLLKPYETNCGLWIWAIQIKFDWLIDKPTQTGGEQTQSERSWPNCKVKGNALRDL